MNTFYFGDRVLAFALALIVWSLLWGSFDLALRQPPPACVWRWCQEETRAKPATCYAPYGRLIVRVKCPISVIAH